MFVGVLFVFFRAWGGINYKAFKILGVRFWKHFFLSDPVFGICKCICVNLNLVNHGWKMKKKQKHKLLLLAHFKQNIQYLSLQRGNFTDLLKVQGFFTFTILLIGFFSYIFSVKWYLAMYLKLIGSEKNL